VDEPDSRALTAASQGDVAAIDDLLAQHLPDVYRFLQRRAGPRVRGEESISDLVQSVCREVLEHAADGRLKLVGEGPFRQWLYRAATMKLLNRHRYWKAERRDPERLAHLPSEAGRDPLPGSTPSPSEQAVDDEHAERMAEAFGRLTDDQRTIIMLAHVEQVPHDEIGERLGISPAHSRTRLSRALARLATLATETGSD
jgi:RNA polymerase sigma-70 factor (ECF subfamily)